MTNILSKINERVLYDPKGFIAGEERAYHSQILNLADKVASEKHRQIIMIAGPSSSGKTTSAHLLREYLQAKGVPTKVLSLDDFYLNPQDQPKLSDGRRDIESVNALDIAEIGRCLNELIVSGETYAPIFDFKQVKRLEQRNYLTLGDGGALIVEGLHGLNPAITDHLPPDNLLKVYISVNEPILNDDGSIYMTSRQVRFARRVIRDYKFRNMAPERTMFYWGNVVKEEEKNLLRYKPLADERIVTLHGYELCFYAKYFKKFLNELPVDTENYNYFNQTAKALNGFECLDEGLIPRDSLLVEFMG